MEMIRLLMEIIGWILTGFGAYYVFEENTMVIHYIALVIGIILLALAIPKNLRKRNK